MRTFGLVLVGMVWLSGSAYGQEITLPESARPIGDSVERLSRQLWPVRITGQPRQAEVDENGRPRFRGGVEVTQFKLPPPWWDRGSAQATRPVGGTVYHQEFLNMVTPQAFRSSTIPMGISTDPGAIINSIKGAWYDWQERRARERVARELAEFIAAKEASQR